MNDNPAIAEVIVSDQGAVRCIALHRPASKNGLTVAVNAALIQALQDAGQKEAVRAVLLTGRGGNFCSGLDLKAALSMAQEGLGDVEGRMRTYFHGLIRAIRVLDKPVVAFVDGPAVGFGCDLALACDLRLGSDRASFGEVFVKRGLMPDGGGTFTLPRIVGLGPALDMMLLGDMVGADDALRLGLVTRRCDDEAAALEIVTRLAAGPPQVLRHIKRAVYAAVEGTLDQALEAEVRGQLQLLQSQDFAEGISAFLQKRPPQFSGK